MSVFGTNYCIPRPLPMGPLQLSLPPLAQTSSYATDKNKGGYSSNCKIVRAAFLHLMAKFTLPFSRPVKSDHNYNV